MSPIACSPPREIPYVVVIPDLMHRYYPELPEYRWPKPVARNTVYGRYARDAAAVEGFHAAAVAHGGVDAGGPGLRPRYGDGYFAAFVIDPDGHRIEAVWHG